MDIYRKKKSTGGAQLPHRAADQVDQLNPAVQSLPCGPDQRSLELMRRLQLEFEQEAGRALEAIRSARRDLVCAHDKLRNGLSLALYAARKSEERSQ